MLRLKGPVFYRGSLQNLGGLNEDYMDWSRFLGRNN